MKGKYEIIAKYQEGVAVFMIGRKKDAGLPLDDDNVEWKMINGTPMPPFGPHGKRPPLSREDLLILIGKHSEGIRQKMIAEETGINQSSTSEQIDKLENDGYIERKVDPADKRATLLFLTEKGAARAAEVEDNWTFLVRTVAILIETMSSGKGKLRKEAFLNIILRDVFFSYVQVSISVLTGIPNPLTSWRSLLFSCGQGRDGYRKISECHL